MGIKQDIYQFIINNKNNSDLSIRNKALTILSIAATIKCFNCLDRKVTWNQSNNLQMSCSSCSGGILLNSSDKNTLLNDLDSSKSGVRERLDALLKMSSETVEEPVTEAVKEATEKVVEEEDNECVDEQSTEQVANEVAEQATEMVEETTELVANELAEPVEEQATEMVEETTEQVEEQTNEVVEEATEIE